MPESQMRAGGKVFQGFLELSASRSFFSRAKADSKAGLVAVCKDWPSARTFQLETSGMKYPGTGL